MLISPFAEECQGETLEIHLCRPRYTCKMLFSLCTYNCAYNYHRTFTRRGVGQLLQSQESVKLMAVWLAPRCRGGFPPGERVQTVQRRLAEALPPGV